MITCKHITKIFDEQLVLNDFSYSFANSGFYLLYGESGSGKTTFLNILSGFLPFEGGCVEWGNCTFEGQIERDTIAASFDYITQDSFFVDFLTVNDNLRLISEDKDKTAILLERFGLADKGKQMPSTLSGGEKQRLAIIRAILGAKKVLFLDEPTAALDNTNKTAVFNLLSDLSREMLIICTSHDSMARNYADHVIEFTKVKEKATVEAFGQNSRKWWTPPSQIPKLSSGVGALTVADSSSPTSSANSSLRKFKKKHLTHYLHKWFRSKRRNQVAGALFLLFLMLSSVLCLFADLPQNKKEATLENIYNLHTIKVTVHNQVWKDISPSDEGIKDILLSYTPPLNAGIDPSTVEGGAIPIPDYELSLDVIPYEADLFCLSDKIAYGTYFTAANQVILSPEMAEEMASGDPKSLIGQRITRNIYKLGNTEFEIVGIFEPFNEYEKHYMTSFGIGYQDPEHYNPSDEIDRFFINSAFTAQFEEDVNFNMNGQRTYFLLFDSYKDMTSYAEKHGETLRSIDSLTVTDDLLYVEERFGFTPICYTLLPIAIFMVFFSTLFYIVLKKTEFTYNNRFIAVFEYSGYDKKKVIHRFILLNILDLLKSLVIAESAALVISLIVNHLNHRNVFIPYEIFTFNIPLMIGYNLIVILTTLIALNVLFRRVKVASWYENLIRTRDLI